jgi:hypothetical protein
MALITTISKGAALSVAEMDANLSEIERRTGGGWKDIVTPLDSSAVPVLNAPDKQPFGASGLRQELRFHVGDYTYCYPVHVPHDIKVGGKAYIHVHWSSDGADTNPVKWEFQYTRAIGHQQAYFSGEASAFVSQAGYGGAWRHMVAEVATIDALTLTEPDELILITLRRVANGATENTDNIFVLCVDLHYESDRDSTPNKSPSFYA